MAFWDKKDTNQGNNQGNNSGNSQNNNPNNNQGNNQNNGNQQNPNQQNNSQGNQNSGIADTGQHGNPQNPVNPLDFYSKSFQNTDNETDKKAPVYAISDEQLGKVAGSLDFMQGIDGELLKKAQGGDVNALMDMMNHVGRQAYSSAMSHNSSLTNTFVSERLGFEDSNLPTKLKSQLTQNELGSVTNYNHPAVKAQLNEMAQRIAKANPDYTPQEVAKQAKDYFSELAKAISGNDGESNANGQKASEITDWSKWLG